ncbi:exported hypothetical protein [Candidatus Sulfotelmatobacter kueseliae]|uniref:Uncharacterized protein n=1 Tax=Candidatus Sulfotelmatobacter kueseliae TaxID=2042962 RepID=A0A2U3KFI0_9BACT|nr:exported hypothetical protein [Candidatus Sulfotelmatobacter kueseliae]
MVRGMAAAATPGLRAATGAKPVIKMRRPKQKKDTTIRAFGFMAEIVPLLSQLDSVAPA